MDVRMYLDDRGRIEFSVEDKEKNRSTYYARKSENGYTHYHVEKSVGDVPKALQGSYSNPDKCKDAIVDYLKKQSVSRTIKRDSYRKMREEKKNASVQSDSKDDLQQGSSD